MDAKEAIEQTTQTDKTAKRIKRAIRYVEKKILKAIKKGRWWVRVDHEPGLFWHPFNYLIREERELIIDYFDELGFTITEQHCGMHEYSWKPKNFKQVFRPCTEDSKLRHVVLSGQPPKVII